MSYNCPTCGSELETSENHPGKLFCSKCRKAYKENDIIQYYNMMQQGMSQPGMVYVVNNGETEEEKKEKERKRLEEEKRRKIEEARRIQEIKEKEKAKYELEKANEKLKREKEAQKAEKAKWELEQAQKELTATKEKQEKNKKKVKKIGIIVGIAVLIIAIGMAITMFLSIGNDEIIDFYDYTPAEHEEYTLPETIQQTASLAGAPFADCKFIFNGKEYQLGTLTLNEFMQQSGLEMDPRTDLFIPSKFSRMIPEVFETAHYKIDIGVENPYSFDMDMRDCRITGICIEEYVPGIDFEIVGVAKLDDNAQEIITKMGEADDKPPLNGRYQEYTYTIDETDFELNTTIFEDNETGKIKELEIEYHGIEDR